MYLGQRPNVAICSDLNQSSALYLVTALFLLPKIIIGGQELNIYKYDIVFQEVPDHIALAFYVCGCPLRCPGCHSPELWTERTGTVLTINFFKELLVKYQNQADCVLFMGGEWHSQELVEFLRHARNHNYKTALYTGLYKIPEQLTDHLNFLKTGPWDPSRGPLGSLTTNQIFQDLTTGTILNHLFQR